MPKCFFRMLSLFLCLALCFPIAACAPDEDESETEDQTVWLDMNTDFEETDTLPRGNGQRARVILLLGQSNASGSSIVSYLEKNSSPEDFERYRAGYPSVLINYCIDDHNVCSEGEYVKVDLNCGAAEGFFGPEVGMADVLSRAYPDETVFILKYTMSGYSLHHHWLCAGERGSIYDAFLKFTVQSMENLRSLGYDAEIGAVCWMQGESDTTDFKGERYFDNLRAFTDYLREDLASYAENGQIYFIDAGISNGPYCLPAYPAVNEAKLRHARLFSLNLYFSTIDAGLVTTEEPEGDPDWGHYDALSELKLGQIFGEKVIETYDRRGRDLYELSAETEPYRDVLKLIRDATNFCESHPDYRELYDYAAEALGYTEEAGKTLLWALLDSAEVFYPYRGSPHGKRAVGYAFKDLNADGVQELILFNESGAIGAVFSLSEGSPVLLGNYTSRRMCHIDAEGLLHEHEIEGADYVSHTVSRVAEGGGALEALIEFGTDGSEQKKDDVSLRYYQRVGEERVPITKDDYLALEERYGVCFDVSSAAEETLASAALKHQTLFPELLTLEQALEIAASHWGIRNGDVDKDTGYPFRLRAIYSETGCYRIALEWLVENDHYSTLEILEIDEITGRIITPNVEVKEPLTHIGKENV